MSSQPGKHVRWIELPGSAPGNPRRIKLLHWRGGAGPRACVIATLRDGEVPPLLVAHQLERLLDVQLAQLRGEVLLLPFADAGAPREAGEVDDEAADKRLVEALARRIGDRLGADPASNVAEIRATLRELLAAPLPPAPAAAWRQAVLRLAIDCDIVLVLRAEPDACLHLHAARTHWPRIGELAHALQAELVLLGTPPAGDPLVRACLAPFEALAARHPQHIVPPACCAASVVLRGRHEVDDETARIDAEGLLRFLRARGVLAGNAALPAEPPRASERSALATLVAPTHGVLLWERPLGCDVEAGELLGWILVPGERERVALRAPRAGLFLLRAAGHYVEAGTSVARIAGQVAP